MIAEFLEESTLDFEVEAQAKFIARRQRDAAKGIDFGTTIAEAIPEFRDAWADPETRVGLVPPKELIAAVARKIQTAGGRAVTARSIVNRMKATEVPEEMAVFLADVEQLLSAS
jgi:hypothetical protein